MSEITNYLGGYLNELNNYMERLNTDRLSRKDRHLFLEMSNEYYDVFKKASDENTVFPEELLETIAAFNDTINGMEDNSRELANQFNEVIGTIANDYIEKVERSELQYSIFRNDAEILRLQEEKILMLQSLVDLEMKRGGQISSETMAILEVQHSEIINGQVREIGEWEQKNPSAEEYPIVPNSGIDKEKQRVKLHLPYMTRENFLDVKENLKRMGARFDTKKKEWYVEISAGQDVIDDINRYLAKHDDAIYLKLPFTEDAQKFKKIVEEIKQNGARYNPFKKRWYITEAMDRSKFFAYLPAKDSVHEKLHQYKSNDNKLSSVRRLQEHGSKEPERI